jgi:phospholipase/carboxylesterase
LDQPDLERRTHELATFVLGAAACYGLRRDGVIAVGFSNGANIAAAMMLLRPEVLRAGVLIRAMVPLIPKEDANLTGKSVLILSGTSDPIVPRDNAQRLAKIFANAGAIVTHHWIEASHGVTMEDIETAREWIARA